MTPSDHAPAQLARQILVEQLKSLSLFLPAAAYLLAILVGVDESTLPAALVLGAASFALFFVVTPLLASRKLMSDVLSTRAGEAPEASLVRILEAPRRIEMGTGNHYMLAALAFVGGFVVLYGRSPALLLAGAAVMGALNMVTGIRTRIKVEEMLLPWAAAAFRRAPLARPTGHWLHWARQSWYLPFLMAAVLTCTVICIGVVLVTKTGRTLDSELARLASALPSDVLLEVRARAEALGRELIVPVVCLAALILGGSMYSAWLLARRNALAIRSLQETIDALAAGAPRLPDWVSTDEIGDISLGLAAVLEKLRDLALALRRSAEQLVGSAEQLGGTAGDQNRMLGRQAAAIHETQVTAQEIRQTSELASERTHEVMKLADRADEVGRSGEAAIDRTLDGLTEIREQVEEMAGHIRGLGERARQVVSITATVKDLADQSNMLALNAAIEAVRSGEHGKGFAVVAREIRSLADQSLQATHQVRERLDDIGEAIRLAVTISEKGSAKLEASFEQVRASGDSLRELSGIVRENASSVRQIAGAVGQQNAGIAQIFEAIRELSTMMDETMQLVDRTKASAGVVENIAVDVNDIVRQHGVMDEPSRAPAPAAQDGALRPAA